MQIDSNFDSGNIIVQAIEGTHARLAIRPDTDANFFQWFYFRVTDPPGVTHTFTLSNAAMASYPDAWQGYRTLASYDEVTWFRVPTTYDGTTLQFSHTPTQAATSYAFFVPYKQARREKLLRECEASPLASRRMIGSSIGRRPIDVVVFGSEKRPVRKVWVITRQHAGEPMAEYATEGLIRRLLDTDDAAAQQLRERATVYVVPNLNPDGSSLGNLRANAAGVDLNRVWDKPSTACPEIVSARNAIAATDVDYFIDIHGDETRPFIWLAHPHIDTDDQLKVAQRRFEDELGKHNPEVRPAPAELASIYPDDLGMSVDYITATYHCPAWIIELPFKETLDVGETPDSLLPAGCLRVGRSCVDALLAIMD